MPALSRITMNNNIGLPSKFQEQTFCTNCNADINAENMVCVCAGCGLHGCQDCMIKDDNYEQWFCYDYDEADIKKDCIIAFLDKVVDKLHKVIGNFASNKIMEDKE